MKNANLASSLVSLTEPLVAGAARTASSFASASLKRSMVTGSPVPRCDHHSDAPNDTPATTKIIPPNLRIFFIVHYIFSCLASSCKLALHFFFLFVCFFSGVLGFRDRLFRKFIHLPSELFLFADAQKTEWVDINKRN